jgi:hypothetical protein
VRFEALGKLMGAVVLGNEVEIPNVGGLKRRFDR